MLPLKVISLLKAFEEELLIFRLFVPFAKFPKGTVTQALVFPLWELLDREILSADLAVN